MIYSLLYLIIGFIYLSIEENTIQEDDPFLILSPKDKILLITLWPIYIYLSLINAK